MRFRTARESDLPAIVSLLADDPLGAQREAYTDPLPLAYRNAFFAMRRQSGNSIIVAVKEGVVVGCMQLTLIEGLSRLGTKRAQIEAVRVDRAHRGDKVGEKLIEYAIGIARRRGCALVQLTTDRTRRDAHRFYERLGFVPSHIGMKLNLDQT